MLSNYTLAHPQICGGADLNNPAVNDPGAIGFVAQLAGGGGSTERWIVSCYHVLIGSPASAPVNNQPVEQGGVVIARIDAARCDAQLDCAAAKIDTPANALGEIMGIGRIMTPVVAAPAPGLRVMKSGPESGVTEGEVAQVNGDVVTIRTIVGTFNPAYEVSCPGDSGSLWITRDTHQPVALHMSSANGIQQRALARRIDVVLNALGLEIV